VFQFAQTAKVNELHKLNRGKIRIVEGRSAYLPIDQRSADPDKMLALVESVLRPK
jgi:hypothetical protein